jgi:hypothetical protein
LFVSNESGRMESIEDEKFFENRASIVWLLVREERKLCFCGPHVQFAFRPTMGRKLRMGI